MEQDYAEIGGFMRYLLLFIVMVLSFSRISAEELRYKMLKANAYNDVLKSFVEADTWINCDNEKDVVYWYVKDFMCTVIYNLTPERRAQLIQAISKYEEWNSKAILKQVTLEKDISALEMSDVGFKYGDEWFSSRQTAVKFSFFSQNTNRHQIVVSPDELRSISNEFIKYQFPAMYFEYADIIVFKKALGDENIKRCIAQHNKKKAAIESDFK